MSQLTSLNSLPDNFIVRVSETMIISLHGEQADSYLHGQLTVNINSLSHDIARHYAHCDNKGKTWSVGYVAREANRILMITNRSSGAHSLVQLNKYGVFSKVDIEDATDGYTTLFISSGIAHQLLASFFEEANFTELCAATNEQGSLKSATSNAGLIFNAGLEASGLIAVLRNDVATSLLGSLQDDVAVFTQPVFDALQIQSVHAAIDDNAIAEYVPQMMNIQALEGIDFDKGCYMGQEVVARTRFLGKNKRAAFSFTLPEAVDIPTGSSLEKQLGENWRIAGKVINSATLDEETWILAVLNNDTTAEDLHRLADKQDVTCYPNTLPYDIEQQPSNIVKKRR